LPRPLASHGGSSLIPATVPLGGVLALARNEPQAQRALSARGPSWTQRALAWLGLEKMAFSPQKRSEGVTSKRTVRAARTWGARGGKTAAKHRNGPVPAAGDRPRRHRRR